MRPSGQTKSRSQYHPTAKPVLSTLLFCLVTLETETMGGFEMLKFSESQYLFIIRGLWWGVVFVSLAVLCLQDLRSQLGIKPRSPQWNRWVLTTGPLGNSRGFYKSTGRRQTIQRRRGWGLRRVGEALTVYHHNGPSSPRGSCAAGFVSQAFVTSWHKNHLKSSSTFIICLELAVFDF